MTNERDESMLETLERLEHEVVNATDALELAQLRVHELEDDLDAYERTVSEKDEEIVQLRGRLAGKYDSEAEHRQDEREAMDEHAAESAR